MRTKVLIAGAAGRDFHNFNVVYRDLDEYDVVAFTATQIPDIAGRVYPPLLAGALYPEGIPIRPEAELADLIREHAIADVAFAAFAGAFFSAAARAAGSARRLSALGSAARTAATRVAANAV